MSVILVARAVADSGIDRGMPVGADFVLPEGALPLDELIALVIQYGHKAIGVIQEYEPHVQPSGVRFEIVPAGTVADRFERPTVVDPTARPMP